RGQPLRCDQDHDYGAEQRAFDRGVMDLFVKTLGAGGTQNDGTLPCNPQQVMDYYDGNTVTAMWNYAQRFAMSDNSYGTGYGPSTPGVLNLVTGNTYGATCGPQDVVNGPQPNCGAKTTQPATPGQSQPQGTGTVYGDPDPMFDTCSGSGVTAVGGKNIGDLLSAQNVTWGWFQGGFASPGYVPGQPGSDNLAA